MKLTNKLNLPEQFIHDDFKEPIMNRYSVTELLKPTREIVLTRKYWKDIEVDVSDGITALFGSAVHKVFEEKTDPEESEIKLEVQFGENTVVGIVDHLHNDVIEDYKTVSVSKVTKQDFKDHEMQIKIYALLRYKKSKVITRTGKLYYLMKDWSKVKAVNSSNYPSNPIYIHEFSISDSDYDLAEEYILNKLNSLNKLPMCTEEERWFTGNEYAVYKNVGDKRAAYVTKDEQDAHNYITNKLEGAGEIQVRKGTNLKCDLYCSVREFCRKEDN